MGEAAREEAAVEEREGEAGADIVGFGELALGGGDGDGVGTMVRIYIGG